MYAGAASLYLVLWWRFRQQLDMVLMVLLTVCGIWTKREGTTIALLLLSAFFLGEMLHRGLSNRERALNVLQGSLTAVLPLSPWFLVLGLTHPSGGDFFPVTIPVFVTHISRFPHILLYVALHMLNVTTWGLFWLVLTAVVVLALRRGSRISYGLLLLLAGQLGAYALCFVFSYWKPYTTHIETSLDRLLVQALPLAIIVTVDGLHMLVAPRSQIDS
jgi:hypothetical protein